MNILTFWKTLLGMKIQTTDKEKIFLNRMSDKELVSRIQKELHKQERSTFKAQSKHLQKSTPPENY